MGAHHARRLCRFALRSRPATRCRSLGSARGPSRSSPTDPKDPNERARRIALCGSRVLPGEWHNWHAAYSAPFAWKQRLYFRSFDYLYCFAEK